MLITTRFDGSNQPPTYAELEPLVPPQPPVGNQPTGAATAGPLARLAHFLRITPNGYGTVFNGAVQQSGDTARGVRIPAKEALRAPGNTGELPASRVVRRGRRAANAMGGSAARGDVQDRGASRRDQAVAELRGRFPGTASQPLVDRLMAFSTPPPLAFERPLLIGCVLARLTAGNAVQAGQLLEGLCAAEPRDGAYALQLALARCGGVGIDCLMALHPPASVSTDAVLAPIQREAYAARLRAVDAISHLLPPHLQPRSLAECVCRAGQDDPPLVDNPILVHGLRCAQALVDDPAAEVPLPQRSAYLALRNGLLAPVQLKRAQDRLFKINTYIERASEHGAVRAGHATQRLFGYQKSPMHALTQLGTAGCMSRHPEDDLASRTVVMDAFVARLEAGLSGRRQGAAPEDSLLRRAIRIAATRQWKQHLVEKGWSDRIRVGKRGRAAIAADVATQLGCTAKLVEDHPALATLRRFHAGLLGAWSSQEGIDQSLPVLPAAPGVPGDDRSYALALTRFAELENHGDVILRRPTAAQTRHLLHHAIAGARQTYSVTFSQGNTMGVQGSAIDLLALTPAVLGIGPSVTCTGNRTAVIVVGSNVHGGQFQVGSVRGGRFDLGILAFAGKRLGDAVNLGLTAGVVPLQIEHSRTQAITLRTRMNVFGSTDPTAWLDLLLATYDALTWKDGEAGPPTDAESAWNQLAQRFYKNPNLSIDDLQARQTTLAGSASVLLGARANVAGVQVGPVVTLAANKTYRNRFRLKDKGANRSTEQHTSSAGHGGTASAGLTGLAPAITGGDIQAHASEAGATQALTLTTANLGSGSVTLLRNAAGVTMRLVDDQGRIDPDYTVKDTEWGTAESFARYIDTQRAAWVAALGGDQAAEQSLDVFLTRLVEEEKRGNVTYGERRRITPLAARRIDHFRAMLVAMADTSGPADIRAKAEIERLEGEVSRVLNDPDSWDPRSMWVLDLNQDSTSKGLSIILQLVSRKTVSAPRQRAVLIAPGAPNRTLAEQDIG